MDRIAGRGTSIVPSHRVHKDAPWETTLWITACLSLSFPHLKVEGWCFWWPKHGQSKWGGRQLVVAMLRSDHLWIVFSNGTSLSYYKRKNLYMNELLSLLQTKATRSVQLGGCERFVFLQKQDDRIYPFDFYLCGFWYLFQMYIRFRDLMGDEENLRRRHVDS